MRWLALSILTWAPVAAAQPGLTALTVQQTADGQTWSLTLQALVLMTLLSVLPAILLMMTAFTRIVVVLAILRQAIGTAQTPSNQVLIGLALFLTFFVMAPVFGRIQSEAVEPYLAGEIDPKTALVRAGAPLRDFMLTQTRETELQFFSDLAGIDERLTPSDVPYSVLLPAFVTSELKTAFQIGFMLFIPFLIIDLAVASVLMSMGMMMLSPLIISLPFKLMLFVMVDGWTLILGTLVASFDAA
ncbi:MAG: flagellar biosynthetic protein FliP [Gammaproteobacteria bacterium]|nr:MAG: flagellar biosynthetic protein FliP [Gammaproteobacteria bacterium]